MKKKTAEIKVGDTLEVWWGRDTITALEPYRGPLIKLLGDGTMIATFARVKVGMTLPSGATFEVVN